MACPVAEDVAGRHGAVLHEVGGWKGSGSTYLPLLPFQKLVERADFLQPVQRVTVNVGPVWGEGGW